MQPPSASIAPVATRRTRMTVRGGIASRGRFDRATCSRTVAARRTGKRTAWRPEPKPRMLHETHKATLSCSVRRSGFRHQIVSTSFWCRYRVAGIGYGIHRARSRAKRTTATEAQNHAALGQPSKARLRSESSNQESRKRTTSICRSFARLLAPGPDVKLGSRPSPASSADRYHCGLQRRFRVR